MANTITYQVSNPKSISKIEEIYNAIKGSFPSVFWDFLDLQESLQYAEFKFKEYPVTFLQSDEMKLLSLSLGGDMASLDVFYDNLLVSIRDRFLPKDWNYWHNISFCERNSKQDEKYCDYASLRVEKNRISLSYTSGTGSKIEDDEEYKLNTLKEMIDVLGLPMIISESGESYKFIHTIDDRYIEGQGGSFNPRPAGFSVELVDASAEEAVKKLKDLVKIFSTGEVFSTGWSISIPPIRRPTEQNISKIKSLLAKKTIPATSYEVNTSFKLNSFSSIDAVKNAIDDKGSLLAQMLQVEFEGHDINLNVLIEGGEYIVELQCNTEIDIALFNEKTNSDFSLVSN